MTSSSSTQIQILTNILKKAFSMINPAHNSQTQGIYQIEETIREAYELERDIVLKDSDDGKAPVYFWNTSCGKQAVYAGNSMNGDYYDVYVFSQPWIESFVVYFQAFNAECGMYIEQCSIDIHGDDFFMVFTAEDGEVCALLDAIRTRDVMTI